MIVDIFAGTGGWSEGLRALGHSDIGIEHDASACATRAAAGHLTICADVATYPLLRFRGRIDGLIASPPCQDFSTAGKRAGIEGATGALMWQVPRWVTALRPRWVACEQVPLALEWWERFAYEFETLGYRTWRGTLNAADYGVPQTRSRAFLLAALDFQPLAPEPVHDRYPQPRMFGEPLQPWISMADALGWGMPKRPYYTIAGTGMPQACVGGNAPRKVMQVEQARGRWIPQTSKDCAPNGTRDGARYLPMIPTITLTEALILQSFRPDYPVQGTKTKQFEQVGNAVPPLLGAHVLRQFLVENVQ